MVAEGGTLFPAAGGGERSQLESVGVMSGAGLGESAKVFSYFMQGFDVVMTAAELAAVVS